jgi:outer membrane immunogenic protein
MKKIFALVVAAAAALATPTIASAADNAFGGVYGQITAGVQDVTKAPNTKDVTYGASVGVNIPTGSVGIVGVEATVDNVFDRRDVSATGRLGFLASDNVLIYGEAGYANYKDTFSRKLDGLRVGGGIEANLSKHSFVSVEYRYTDFQAGVGKHGALVGLGLRF